MAVGVFYDGTAAETRHEFTIYETPEEIFHAKYANGGRGENEDTDFTEDTDSGYSEGFGSGSIPPFQGFDVFSFVTQACARLGLATTWAGISRAYSPQIPAAGCFLRPWPRWRRVWIWRTAAL